MQAVGRAELEEQGGRVGGRGRERERDVSQRVQCYVRSRGVNPSLLPSLPPFLPTSGCLCPMLCAMSEAKAPPREWPEQSIVQPSLTQSGGREGGREEGWVGGNAAKEVYACCGCQKKRREGGRKGRHGRTSPFPNGQVEAVIGGLHDRAEGLEEARVDQALVTVPV